MRTFKTLAALGFLFTSSAFSQQWDHGNLSLVGNYNGDYFLKITNVPDHNNAIPSFNEKLFKLSENLGTDGFAIALAAISSKKQVYMNSDIDSPSGSYPVISVIYLTNKPAVE